MIQKKGKSNLYGSKESKKDMNFRKERTLHSLTFHPHMLPSLQKGKLNSKK